MNPATEFDPEKFKQLQARDRNTSGRDRALFLAAVAVVGAAALGSVSEDESPEQQYRRAAVISNTRAEIAAEPPFSDVADVESQESPTTYNLPIQLFQSPNYTPGRTADIEKIVLHSTEGSGRSAFNWHTSKESEVSSHYLIMEDGSIRQLVADTDTAWHVGRLANKKTIGIELAGYANREGFEFTDAQYGSLALLTAFLVAEHGLISDDVVAHAWVTHEIGGTTHSDPDPNFDWDRFKEEQKSIDGVVQPDYIN